MSKLAAANGIEPVFPYLDRRLVELSLTVPGDYKIKGWQRKVLLRKALNGVVSNKIRQKEKHPFTLSTCQVFDAGWTKLVSKTLSEESVRQRGWFNPLEVAKIRDAAPDNLLYDKQRAALVILELWARMYLDKASLPWQD
jgi:asparagine synthase (glutamine-hydrolysing)